MPAHVFQIEVEIAEREFVLSIEGDRRRNDDDVLFCQKRLFLNHVTDVGFIHHSEELFGGFAAA